MPQPAVELDNGCEVDVLDALDGRRTLQGGVRGAEAEQDEDDRGGDRVDQQRDRQRPAPDGKGAALAGRGDDRPVPAHRDGVEDRIGPLHLGTLSAGAFRELTPEEVDALYVAAGGRDGGPPTPR